MKICTLAIGIQLYSIYNMYICYRYTNIYNMYFLLFYTTIIFEKVSVQIWVHLKIKELTRKVVIKKEY